MLAPPFACVYLDRFLAMRFIDAFMNAELALKLGGYGRMQGGAACADWDSFASSIKEKFDNVMDQSFRDSVAYLVQNPPRKQVINGRTLEWKVSPPPATLSAAQQCLLIVRRVRNNLIHGAKSYALGGADPSERNNKLVDSSRIVLRRVMTLNEEVRSFYR
ncbi:hypothetical protein A7J67_18555 [Achromobacter xylosoxidans]|nr:hypothetical protein A7J67_18555 [Achromobacter xylosoxidans]